MGEVYRAHDTKLNRDVALKVLPEAFALDPDRLARFKREAQVLASLNHPQIGAIYGLEESAGIQALVLELVEGPTLADRLQPGPMPVDQALACAGQVAEALETAHEQGIIHRDLKPANIKLTAGGKVKVLDFGLAKAMEKTPAAATVANSPTLSVLATQAGIIMGTAAYMSPEQAKGADTDRRTDVFSFGVVLFEMLTARQPFHGDTAPEIMASVMIRDADLSGLPANLHPRIVELISRCLEKEPKKRWQAMGDLRLELESIAAAPYRSDATASGSVLRPPLWKRALPVAIAVVLAAAASTGVNRWLSTAQPAEVVRFSFPAADFRSATPALAVSPDGTRLVYVGATGIDRNQLILRNLSEADARPITGSALRGLITSPVFSPDGRFVAYYSLAERALKKIAVGGGTAITLSALTSAPNGAISWRGSAIAVAQSTGIFIVSANGGEPELAVRLDAGTSAASPQIIDERGSVLFAVAGGADTVSGNALSRWDAGQIVVQRPDGTRHVVVSGGADPHYLPTGHLVYALGGSLLAVPFDAANVRTSGGPAPVIEGIARSSTGVSAHVAISAGGTLVFVPGPATTSSARTLGLLDIRDGKVQPIPIPPNSYTQPRLSPDGRLVAVASDDGKERAIWIYDLIGRGPPRRLTFAGRNTSPIWTPDGQFITYVSDQQGDRGLVLQRADGTGSVERLTKAEAGSEHIPESWSPDGRILALRVVQEGTSSIWIVPRDGDRTLKPLLQMKNRSQVVPQFSPDGRWIAYGSNELDGVAFQTFVQPFPPNGSKFQAETQIGSSPVWSHDGRRLFFAYTNRVFALDVQTSPTFVAGQPVEIAGTGGSQPSAAAVRNFDLTPDGKQLLVVLTEPTEDHNAAARGQQINIVLNWTEELKQRVPTK